LKEEFMGDGLSKEVAVVTGAGRGIGRVIAQALAAEGAAVAVCARTKVEVEKTASIIRDAGGRAAAVQLDVRDAASVQRAIYTITQQFDLPSILINNAGTPGPAGRDWEVNADDWWECLDVTVHGALLLCQAVVPGLIERGYGRIINMASNSGTRAVPPITATSIAKTALIRFSEGLAVELSSYGIPVFAIQPGIVRTQLLESYGLQLPEESYVSPERAATLCVKLSSGRYDALSGRFIGIDDDLEEMLKRADEIAAQELYTLRLQA
jgi:NAD(P)-dependent dehydrogenase (short-subunit alcohol dehydrogenase family)